MDAVGVALVFLLGFLVGIFADILWSRVVSRLMMVSWRIVKPLMAVVVGLLALWGLIDLLSKIAASG
ncbi:MAG: hypothetical protein JW850_12820 [Thermoflexales bacterium]|nr:hypothetical protein [Thermoflexales bacterium]